MTTQATLFREVAGGFAIGQQLPKETGDLTKVKSLVITARENDDETRISTRIIELSEEVPEKNLERRGRQYSRLITTLFHDFKYVVVIINDAHLLPDNTIRNLKQLKEVNESFGPEPGIILLGQLDILKGKIGKWPEINQRAFPIKGN